MAKRRMISQELIYDEQFNSLSIEAQNLFIRCLTISDDCGVIPGNDYQLKAMLNLHSAICDKLQEFLSELVRNGMLIKFTYKEKPFYAFKQTPFDNYQAYIIKNRTKSEYLKMKINEFQVFKSDLQEFTVNYSNLLDNGSYHIESNEFQVKSSEFKVKSSEKEIPPKFEDVKYYFSERGINSDEYEKFYDFYESKGWIIGKVKMKNWKASIRNWIKNTKSNKDRKLIQNISTLGTKALPGTFDDITNLKKE